MWWVTNQSTISNLISLIYDTGMGNNATLTKLDFLLYLESPLHLWAEKHGYVHQAPTEFEIHVMNQGYEVEGLARDYVEKYIVSLEENESVQFQNSFFENQFTARTDAIIFKPRSNTYDLYEIKSSTSLKPGFIYDAVFQYLVVNKQIKIDRVFILHLNKDYVRYSRLNLEQLFIAENITEKVHELKMEVGVKREEALEVTSAVSPEGIQHCFKPKDCPCPQICHPDLLDYSIYDIPGLSKKKKYQLIEQGILDIKNVPDSFELNAKQRLIVEVAKLNEEYIDREAITREFQHFNYPLYFLDYETYLSAIPMFDGYHERKPRPISCRFFIPLPGNYVAKESRLLKNALKSTHYSK